jgi:hypothetical protein
MCTYGRFETVRQSATFWKYQDYDNKELIIFNTAPVHIQLDDGLSDYNIRVINQQDETGTSTPFKSLGKVREDSLEYADGDIYICWDDDDMFLPWHMSQGMKKLNEHGSHAWKPEHSYFSMDGGKTYKYAGNSMEASILVDINELKKHGFFYESGSEHLKWLDPMNKSKDVVIESVRPLESYAYVWGSKIAPHKTSGNINHPDNFEHHKQGSLDFGVDKKLTFVDNEQVEQLFVNVYNSLPSPELKEMTQKYLTVCEI